MVDLETNFTLIHNILFVDILATDQHFTEHASGCGRQERLKALFAQTTLLGDTCATEFLHVLAILTLTTVVTGIEEKSLYYTVG